MKDADLNFKAEQLLNEFEQANGSSPSHAWNSSLMQKIAAQPQPTSTGITTTKISVIAFVFILLNLGYCISTFSNKNSSDNSRNTELTTLSNELLIQNTSSTN